MHLTKKKLVHWVAMHIVFGKAVMIKDIVKNMIALYLAAIL